jgi:DUF971 family protein
MRAPDLEVVDGGRVLRVAWTGGSESRISADVLWAECPSALARRRRLDGRHIAPTAGVAIRQVARIGNYAVNIAFSDGHDRGIYPWTLLAELGRRPTPDDFIAPAPDGTA